MAPRLKLPENFRVHTFGSNRNVNGLGKYFLPAVEVTQVSETHVCESTVQPTTWLCLASKAIVVSAEAEDVDIETLTDDDDELTEKKKTRTTPNSLRKRRKVAASTTTRRWQEVWACRFAWAEGKFNSTGDLIGMICRSCTTISGRKKVMVPKADNLEKHEGKRTCHEDGVPLPDLKKGDLYVNHNCKHLKYCELWAGQKQGATVAALLNAGLEAEHKRKGVQFATLFQILSNSRPMCDYDREQHLLRHLKVKNVPRKHWSETTGWEMSEHLHASVLGALRSIVQSARCISISADEVMAIDNTFWIGVHVCVMESWQRIPHLLHLSCVSESGTANHLTSVIMQALLKKGGLTRAEVASKVVCFSVDGVSMFQGTKLDYHADPPKVSSLHFGSQLCIAQDKPCRGNIIKVPTYLSVGGPVSTGLQLLLPQQQMTQ